MGYHSIFFLVAEEYNCKAPAVLAPYLWVILSCDQVSELKVEDIDINSLSMPYLIILSAFYLYLAIKVVFGHRVQFTWRVSAVRKELRLSLPTETELLWHKSFPFQTLIVQF